MASTPRIYLNHSDALKIGAILTLEGNAAHYLAHVLRVKMGGKLHLFGGSSGEWNAEIISTHKKTIEIQLLNQLRAFVASPDIWLIFAPVKNEKIDFIARRATELGISAIQPVRTKHTIVARVNEDRLMANMIEAAEQCERLDVPELKPYLPLMDLLSNWNAERNLFMADESGDGLPVHELLPTLPRGQKAALLIGPEGGFSKQEHGFLKPLPYIKPFTLGPRILRAETAALVGLAHLQAWLGDGDERPRFVSPME